MLEDWQPIWLTLKLAGLTTLILMCLGLPLAWWLSQSRHWSTQIIATIITLPIILPPTVLGFYLLLCLGPNGPIGRLTDTIGLGSLAFSFGGLVVASVIYSLPFAVQPLYTAFANIDRRLLDAAATLRAGPVDCFLHIVLPLSKPGLISAAVLTFAHTIGEFGVILMIGGNIPGETKVLSIAIYDHVESLEYVQAHYLSAGLMLFAFICLFGLYWLNHRSERQREVS